MDFVCRVSRDQGLDFGERNRAYFKQYLKENPGSLLKITPMLPESNKQRRYLEGSIIPLVTYYQDGLDHRNSDDCAKVREWLKMEFSSEDVRVNGFGNRIAKSTKGREALNQFLERVMEWLQDNYAPPVEAVDPNSYKLWRDTVMEGPNNYIDYLIAQHVLK